MFLFSVIPFITILQVVSGDFLRLTKQGVNMNDIVDTLKDTTITSCQVECNKNDACDYIGLNEMINSGFSKKCYLVRRGIATNEGDKKDLYVIRRLGDCDNLHCRSNEDCIPDAKGKRKCACKNGYVGARCETIPLSCQSIKMMNPFLKSGMYKINPSDPITVYCDMEYDERGWMMIANITINDAIPKGGNADFLEDRTISNDIRELDQVGTGRFRLNPTKLLDFDNTFKYLRLYCHKPNGRTISLTTTKAEVLHYFISKKDTRPAACGSFVYDKMDNSQISRMCDQWQSGAWKGESGKARGIYRIPIVVPGLYHFVLMPNRFECDDNKHGVNAGVWMIYVL